MKNLWRRVRLLRARKQAVGDAGFWIGRRSVAERKQIHREQNIEELQRVSRGLAEAVIERSAARAADLIEDAVEHAPALFVLVEALIEKMSEKASALRHAPADRMFQPRHRVLGRRVVLEEADEIACARESHADDSRVGGAVDDVVDAAGLEAAVERDHARLALVYEVPLRSRDDRALCDWIVAHGHHALGALRIDWRVRLVITIGDRRRG